ncbi:MAG TPA: OmpA family protein [Methylothermaceae bacterium]|nr:OmpA family protein [Methylothermaceae bacterium]
MRIVGFILLAWLGNVTAAVFQAPWSAGWRFEGDKLSCQLSQTIPHLGQAVFSQAAGEPLAFYLQLNSATEVAEASVQIHPAPWQHRVLPSRRFPAGSLTTQSEGQQVGVRGPVAEQMLAALFAGSFPTFIYRRPWRGAVDEFQVAVSAVRFWDVYDRYQACRAQLPPYGIRDFQNLRFYFREHQIQLPDDDTTKLRHLARLLQRLGKGQVVVNNVTQKLGGKESQFWFRKRFQQIKQRLRQAGLKPDQVTTKPTGLSPRIDLFLFGPEGLRLYHYGRHQRDLTWNQKRRLQLLARYLTEYFTGSLIVNGYSDGARWRSERTNRAMSKRWAEKVRDYLASQGVDPARMQIRAWGSRHRVASNLTKAGQAKNRRVLIQLVADAKQPAAS